MRKSYFKDEEEDETRENHTSKFLEDLWIKFYQIKLNFATRASSVVGNFYKKERAITKNKTNILI